MPPDETHSIYAIRKQVAVKALTCDATQRYYNEFFTPEETEKRRKRIDENVKRRENDYYTKIIAKIQALKHDVVKPVKSKSMTEMDRAVMDILDNDVAYQKWLQDQPRRRQLMKDSTAYHHHLLHSYWEVKNLAALCYPEPPRGDASKRSEWEQYNAECRRDAVKITRKKVSPERQKLNNMFKEADQKRRARKLIGASFMEMSGSGVEEE